MDKVKYLLDQIEQVGEILKRENQQLKSKVRELSQAQLNNQSELKIKELEDKIVQLERELNDYRSQTNTYETRLTTLNQLLSQQSQSPPTPPQEIKQTEPLQSEAPLPPPQSPPPTYTPPPEPAVISDSINHFSERVYTEDHKPLPNDGPEPTSQPVAELEKKVEIKTEIAEPNIITAPPPPEVEPVPVPSAPTEPTPNTTPEPFAPQPTKPWEKWNDHEEKPKSYFEYEDDPFFSNDNKVDDSTFSEDIKKL